MFRKFNKVGSLRLITDLFLIVIAFSLASVLSQRGFDEKDRFILAAFVVGWYISSRVTNAYDEFRTERFVGEMLILFENILVQIIVAGQMYFLFNEHEYARTFVMWYIGLLTIGIILKSYVFKKALIYYRKKGGNTRALVLIGYNQITESIIQQITKSPHFGYKIKGIVAQKNNLPLDQKYLGNLEAFYEKYQNIRIDDIIITSDNLSQQMLQNIIAFADNKAIRTKVIPNFQSLYQNRFEIDMFAGYPLISVRGEPLQEFHWRYLKRGFDIFFSILVILLIFSWLLPILGILIKLDSPGPIFFRQDRWGVNGKKFKCFKFRSMKVESRDVTENGEFNQAKEGDKRVTKLGAFLRKSSIDELPQFFNVLRNEMSVVGPRPHAHEHNIRSKDHIDKYMLRHWVKPGISGWAQVNGFRGETRTSDQMQQRVNADIWYIENWSFWLDLKIVLMTIYNAVKGETNAY